MSDPLIRPHFEDQAYRELARSRRYARPMTILVLLTDPPGRPRPWGVRRAREVSRVEEQVRRYDLVHAARGHIAVLCPELDPDAGHRLAERLSTSLGLRVGAASFPGDGANVQTLLQLAQDRAAGRRAPLEGAGSTS